MSVIVRMSKINNPDSLTPGSGSANAWVILGPFIVWPIGWAWGRSDEERIRTLHFFPWANWYMDRHQ